MNRIIVSVPMPGRWAKVIAVVVVVVVVLVKTGAELQFGISPAV